MPPARFEPTPSDKAQRAALSVPPAARNERRTKAFEYYLSWHPMIRDAQRTVNGFRFSTNELVFPMAKRRPVRLPIDAGGNFDQSVLFELAAEAAGRPQHFPTNANRISKAYHRQRVWDLGIALAAVVMVYGFLPPLMRKADATRTAAEAAHDKSSSASSRIRWPWP